VFQNNVRSRGKEAILTFEVEDMKLPQMAGYDYPLTQCHTLEDWNTELHHYENLTKSIQLFVAMFHFYSACHSYLYVGM
jgi:hypothetical protein